MKIRVCLVLALLAVTVQPAAAQWRSYGGRHFEVQQRQRSGGFQRGQPQREFRQPDYQNDYRQLDRRQDGRLTDEERRNLHRDLDRANREIYKGR